MKIAREEMSVPIEGWCPLYTEFGFGDSWYQAKSNGLEPPMQDAFVGKYAKNGVPYWKGDIKGFFDTIGKS
ncbi:MAG: hypothetical protein LBM93_04640 [Oscillospiraceae bacterium]|jgi:DNA polymerase-1|nr:hypothetical protein [Oscillospiraceae bacterium]